jgi:DNA-binding MarR family transcriptional regulator
MKSTKKRPLKQIKYITVRADNVLYDYRLEPLDMIVYGELCVLSNKLGYCYASNAALAKLRNTSERTLKRSIHRLKKFGHIEISNDKNKNRKIKIFSSSKTIKKND